MKELQISQTAEFLEQYRRNWKETADRNPKKS
jgi:hypothetical protein